MDSTLGTKRFLGEIAVLDFFFHDNKIYMVSA